MPSLPLTARVGRARRLLCRSILDRDGRTGNAAWSAPAIRVDAAPARAEYRGAAGNNAMASWVAASAMSKSLRTVLFLVILAGLCWARPGAATAPDYAAIVVDAESGAVLQSVSATARWYPASLTKVMTV